MKGGHQGCGNGEAARETGREPEERRGFSSAGRSNVVLNMLSLFGQPAPSLEACRGQLTEFKLDF